MCLETGEEVQFSCMHKSKGATPLNIFEIACCSVICKTILLGFEGR